MTSYKVVELTTVTDEEMEKVLNKWASDGWCFEGMHFAMKDSSKRPSMAFIIFTMEEKDV
jgi:hypothetical protein